MINLIFEACFKYFVKPYNDYFQVLTKRRINIGSNSDPFEKGLNWTPGIGGKGPIKQVRPSVHPSVRPSFCLSVSFLRIGSLVFYETQHGVRGPYIVICDIRQKLPKMVQNGPKTGFLNFLRKSRHSFCLDLCKMKVLMIY